MSKRSITTIFAALAVMAFMFDCRAQQTPSIEGTWGSEVTPLDDGTSMKIYFYNVKQNGEQLTGRFIQCGANAKLSDSYIRGTHFRIGEKTWGMTAEGEIVGDTLKFRLTGAGDPLDGYHLAYRCDTTAAVPPLLPLPALHNVPWNGLAKTPPMGWNSWNLFHEKITDAIVREMADAMVSSGMRDAGYVYVNIDDTWEGQRDARGNIQSNSKFPDMKALADYIHSLGLKFGIYTGPGHLTCGGYVASYGHEEQDARTFAAWGVDYLKYDYCSINAIYDHQTPEMSQAIAQKMGDALLAAGRPVVYSLSGGWPDWAAKAGGNLCRTSSDIEDKWPSMESCGFSRNELAPLAGHGYWNDPDMLEIGNGGMTNDEYRTHISLWCIKAAPLIAGNDIRTMTEATRAILLNREVIAIDQDTLGKQGTPFSVSGKQEVWTKQLAGGGMAIALFNRGESTQHMSVRLADLKLPVKARIRDLWAHKDVVIKNGVFEADVPAHGVVMIKVSEL